VIKWNSLKRGFFAVFSNKMLKALKEHENYKELIWMLAKMDFKLRYQGSFLGYVWAILQPLLMFLVLAAVFSGVFGARAGSDGVENYALQLLVALMMFTFFSEGTNAGLNSLKNKSQLVTKIYVPRWSIILASTINSGMVFLMNIIVIILFFAGFRFLPSFNAIILFFIFAFALYFIILSFSLISGPLLLYLRDVSMIWSVVLRVMFYTVPILYPLTLLPVWTHQIILANPVAFVIHFTKESMFNGHYPDLWQSTVFVGSVIIFFILSIFMYRKLINKVAEKV
jgi:ABC-type polysaccharide/polyol phosphate export permease